MKKLLLALLILCTFAEAVRAHETTPKEARQAWLRGRYEEALALYTVLADRAETAVVGAIGLSRVHQSQGDYAKAAAVVERGLTKLPAQPDLLARKAEVHYLRGEWDPAIAAADKALASKDDHFLARWVRTQVLRDKGDYKTAESECRWFVRTYSSRSDNDNDIKDPDILLIIGQAGAENARWNRLPDQFPFILNEVYGDAFKYDKDLWQSEYLAGVLLLEKFNRAEALAAFEKALTINPQAAEAWVGKGMAALQKFDVKDAEEAAERALRINPNLPEALRLRADANLAAGDLGQAFKDLEHARRSNPRDEHTLGRIGACLVLQKKKGDLEGLTKEILTFDPTPGQFYLTLAEQLDERRHFEIAETYYQKALALRPWLMASQSGLGLLYMRMGRETEAREMLQKAFQNDAFNIRVSNMLKVLRHLDNYETIKTPHFILRFDAATDRALAEFQAEYLERLYADLADSFDFQPAGPILVELFNNHEMFSGRTIALPDLHTIGACTGKVIAMVSPRGKGIAKPFNWARVLRHELVHIFNLEQTRHQVPHWFTEGLAVRNEGFPRPATWTQLLLERVPTGDVMDLDTINFGFIRPKNQLDWHMAYCQSQLYVDYLTKRHGPEAVGKLLAAFGEGMDVDTALQKSCQVDKETFEKGYRSFLNETIRGLGGRKPASTRTLGQLQKANAADPNDLETAALLAEQFLLRRRNGEARKLVDEILMKEKAHPLACYIKASLLLSSGEEEEARKLLETALDIRPPEPKVFQSLGKSYFDASDFGNAERVFLLARKAEPHESKWLTWLARVYTQTKATPKLIEALRQLVPMDADDLATRKRVAQLLLEQGDFPAAENYARQALEIDVLDAASQGVLLGALEKQGKEKESSRLKKMLGKS